MYAIIASLLLPALCLAQVQTPLKFTDCGSHARISSILIAPHEQDSTGKYIFRNGQTYTATVVFEPTENFPASHTYDNNVVGIFSDHEEVFPTNHNPCTDGDIDCSQIHVGDTLTYRVVVTVPKLTAELRLAAKWRLQDTTTNKDVLCFVFGAHVMPPATQ